ncbi:MAG: inositol monophosphatase family protein [Microthrixaceae bacterium]
MSLCAVDGSGPWVAMVAAPVLGDVWTAVRGAGAWIARPGEDRRSIRVAPRVNPSNAIVAVNGWSDRRPPVAQCRALGAASIELCLVAQGVLDGYVNVAGDAHGVWDYLAAALVLLEAGGSIVDAHGRDLVVVDHDLRRSIVGGSTAGLVDRLVREWARDPTGYRPSD